MTIQFNDRLNKALDFFDSVVINSKNNAQVGSIVTLNGYKYSENGNKRYFKINAKCKYFYISEKKNTIEFRFVPLSHNEGITGSMIGAIHSIKF